MGLITKSDLDYDYSWTTYDNDDPEISGEPDSTLLNREEGYEMLYFINKLAEKWDLKKTQDGNKIEKMIKEYVPKNIHSQEKIMNWIKKEWNNY
ncbi:MAG: hypothetical protein A2X12_06340 [Bacteroidetes bacterium GWE2_29_8]|nr:MAG: hypothetical protein A2X12_06340 [Bacteroidetes bacterium GWE2_29_8]OFY21225.1 MAG: hypothetical protein A2X02_10420 [Bacteroidetes bacterium GWF2_29_10]